MIHVYPGMGATSEMYSGDWRMIPNTVFHDWPRWNGESTISSLASRLIDEHGIKIGDEVIGSSLGGIVACEIANLVTLKKLTLIGSAVSKDEISRLLSILHPLIDVVPINLARLSAEKLPHELSGMFSESEPEFIRSMTKAIFSWGGLKSDVPLLRIHGNRDLVIPLPMDVDDPIKGGHLVAMTHAKDCIEKIRKC
ncbi:hypothetical protein MLD52_18790 [Puniceicoccaceae bacterium K14]|nr:hypothetical protein [Puniceicoccaceae bacterium K14]